MPKPSHPETLAANEAIKGLQRVIEHARRALELGNEARALNILNGKDRPWTTERTTKKP